MATNVPEVPHLGIDSYLTEPDRILLENLFADTDPSTDKVYQSNVDGESDTSPGSQDNDKAAIDRLRALNDPIHLLFQPTVFVTWDDKDLPEPLKRWLIRPYVSLASTIVRRPTDVVFLTHILLYLSVNLPSALWLYDSFTWLHGIVHAAYTFWCIGSFTLLMHNHIHNAGVLSHGYRWLDVTFPYMVSPLMGHTWNSYYYHHVKHHHVEGNGPNDLSSTVRCQRDSLLDFSLYITRFMLFVWFELPLYFLRTGKKRLAANALGWEVASIVFLAVMTAWNPRASTFVLLVPFGLVRLGLMVGNWGQHALIDENDPNSDMRSSITLVDVASNRFCFNDGYHTAHHLNPRRHWRDHPLHYLQSKRMYRDERSLTFHNIDYMSLTYRLLRKDYMYLARCLVPAGEQQRMSVEEIASMLETKTRRFTEHDIREKFGEKYARKPGMTWSAVVRRRLTAVCGVMW